MARSADSQCQGHQEQSTQSPIPYAELKQTQSPIPYAELKQTELAHGLGRLRTHPAAIDQQCHCHEDLLETEPGMLLRCVH